MSEVAILPKHVAAMAAHLGDIGSRKLREGDLDGGGLAFHMADEVLRSTHQIKAYREGLSWSMGILSGDDSDEIDAAVKAILDGKQPPWSLPALVEKAIDDTVRMRPDGDDGHLGGKLAAFSEVLIMIGCPLTAEPR